MTTTAIERMEEQRKKLDAKIKRAQSREAEKRRKVETQAKILLGAALLKRIEKKDSKAEEIYLWCRETYNEKDQQRLDKAMKQLLYKQEKKQQNKPAATQNANQANQTEKTEPA